MRADHHEILGVSSSASQEDIKKAFRRLVKDLHPDRLPDGLEKENSEKKLKQIITSYKYLSRRQRGQNRQPRDASHTSITSQFFQNQYIRNIWLYLEDTYRSVILPYFHSQNPSNIVSYVKGKYRSTLVPLFQHRYVIKTVDYCKGKYRTTIAPHFQNEFWLITFPNFIDKFSSQKLERIWKRVGAPAIILGAIFTYGLLGFFIVVVLVAMSPSW